jgi:hypothetical protein
MFVVTNEMIALAGVFFVCMIGVAYHTITLNRMKRDLASKRKKAAATRDSVQAGQTL